MESVLAPVAAQYAFATEDGSARVVSAFAPVFQCFIADDMLEQLPLAAQVGKTLVGGIDLNKARMRRVVLAALGICRSRRLPTERRRRSGPNGTSPTRSRQCDDAKPSRSPAAFRDALAAMRSAGQAEFLITDAVRLAVRQRRTSLSRRSPGKGVVPLHLLPVRRALPRGGLWRPQNVLIKAAG
jgi:hypothetical protein